MLICHCHAVTDRRIRDLVRAGCRSVRDVQRRTGAGTGCSGCASTLHEIVELETRALAQDDSVERNPVQAAG